MKFVTSFNPNARLGRQQYCVGTWAKYGLPIIGVQRSAEEIDKLRPLLSEVTSWEVSDEGGEVFGRPACPSIRSMVAQAIDSSILLINSDISVKDPVPTFEKTWIDGSDNRLVIGIRKDFIRPGGRKYLNKYGIDAFRVSPEMVDAVPHIGFAVACPCWDYWFTWHMHYVGYRIEIANSSLLHEVHPVNWSKRQHALGQSIVRSHYRITPKMLTVFILQTTKREKVKDYKLVDVPETIGHL